DFDDVVDGGRCGDSDALRQPLRWRGAGLSNLAHRISDHVAELRAHAPADRLAWPPRLCRHVRRGAGVRRRIECQPHPIDWDCRRRVGDGSDRTGDHGWVRHRPGTDLERFEPFEPFDAIAAIEPLESFIRRALMIPAHFLQPASATAPMTAEEL